MRTFISAGSCSAIVAAATISLMAQTPAPQGTTTTSTDRHVTVTGCLRPAPASTDTSTATGTTGTTGTSGTTAAPNPTDSANAKFVLADAAMSPSTDTAPQSATGGAPTTTTSKDGAQTYRLIANPTALAPHVGKKLELTGTIVDPSSASSVTADQAGSGSGPVLRVESGKIVGASCQN